MNVRGLVFDVFGTLVDWRSGVAAAFADLDVPGDPHELADDWRARYVPSLLQVNGGERPWANLDELHAQTLDQLLAERDIELRPEARAELVGAWHELEAWPDVHEGLQALRREWVVATLSNGHIALLVDLVRYAGLHFDCLLSAELFGAYKPAREVYQGAARLLGLPAEQVMLVAAHPSDLEFARRAGLRTAFVQRPLEYGPGSPRRSDPHADVSAEDLTGVLLQLA